MHNIVDHKQLYEQAVCGLLSFQSDGTILHANTTFLNWAGINETEVKKIKLPDLLYKGGKLYYTLFVQPLLQLHRVVNEISLDIKTPTGSIPVLFSANYLTTIEGTDIINAVVFKIGDRRKYETEILKEKDQIKVENAIKTQALADIAFEQAHLIRAPLANILGLIHLLEESKETDPDSSIIVMLKESALKLDGVIRKIIDLSIPEES
jgi:sigma-B regulation protein RsbU (phosphoserine phosphatase)